MAGTKSKANLDALDALLESEKKKATTVNKATPAAAIDDGLVTSAPGADQVGSLLTDLLNEAKKEADRERASLDQRLKVRDDEDRLSRQREEALRREQLQKQLQEETRRRNEALTRREREEAATRNAEEERQQRLATETEGLAQSQAVAVAAKRSKVPLVAAALVIAGLAGGLVYALQPKGVIALSDIRAQSSALLVDATAKWQVKVAEQERMAALEREAAAAKEAAAKAQAEAHAARGETAEAEAKAKAAAEKAEKAAAAAAEESKSNGSKSKGSSKGSTKKGGFALPTGVF